MFRSISLHTAVVEEDCFQIFGTHISLFLFSQQMIVSIKKCNLANSRYIVNHCGDQRYPKWYIYNITIEMSEILNSIQALDVFAVRGNDMIKLIVWWIYGITTTNLKKKLLKKYKRMWQEQPGGRGTTWGLTLCAWCAEHFLRARCCRLHEAANIRSFCGTEDMLLSLIR